MTHLSKETLVTLEHAQQRVSRMLESKNHIRHGMVERTEQASTEGRHIEHSQTGFCCEEEITSIPCGSRA